MKRVRLFEFEDLGWFPGSIRDLGTDILRTLWEMGIAVPVLPRLQAFLERTGSREVIDLCSGGGGPAIALTRGLARRGIDIRLTLTDKYPNLQAFRDAARRTNGRIRFRTEPVDATAVPADLGGPRTMFGALHHFSPAQVQRILQDAVDRRAPVAFFDLSARTPPPREMLLLGNPVGVLLLTPFIRPFRWSRLFWTYLVPVVPLYVFWDGFVSGLRLYSPAELRTLVDELAPNGYEWHIETDPFPHSLTSLIGFPPNAD